MDVMRCPSTTPDAVQFPVLAGSGMILQVPHAWLTVPWLSSQACYLRTQGRIMGGTPPVLPSPTARSLHLVDGWRTTQRPTPVGGHVWGLCKPHAGTCASPLPVSVSLLPNPAASRPFNGISGKKCDSLLVETKCFHHFRGLILCNLKCLDFHLIKRTRK